MSFETLVLDAAAPTPPSPPSSRRGTGSAGPLAAPPWGGGAVGASGGV